MSSPCLANAITVSLHSIAADEPAAPLPPAPAPSAPASPEPQRAEESAGGQSGGATAVAERPAQAPSTPKLDKMPPYKVLLHNDDHNDQDFVTITIMQIAAVHPVRAFRIMMEAHDTGVGLVCVTHKELAELKCEQLQSKGLVATIEPA